MREYNSKAKDTGKMLRLLDWTYEKTLNGMPGTLSAEELAREYLSKNNYNNIDAFNMLTKWQVRKCATSGFVAGLGGAITLPVAIPANIANVIYIQMRMIAAIAYIGGYDLKDDSVKTLVYMCLTGQAALDIGKKFGIELGKKVSTSAIKKMSYETIKAINKKVGFRLITKFGEKGIINLGKAIPIVGGVIGGSFDLASTKTIAEISKKAFLIS